MRFTFRVRSLILTVIVFYSSICFAIAENDNSSVSNMLLGDKISNLSSIFSYSDSWFMRNFSYRQSLYNSMGVKYNNVVLNNVVDGSFRGDLGIFQSTKIDIISNETDIFSTSNTPSGNVSITSSIADSSGFVSMLEGGNVFGSIYANYNSHNDYMKWQTGLHYITSGGYDVSASKPDSIGLARANTVFDKITANGRLKIFDTKSSIDAEFIFSKGNQNMPYSLYPERSIFLKEPDFTMNLFNLMFQSYINSDMEFKGNVFYVRTKSILEKYDSPNLQSQELISSFAKKFEDSRFGWNSYLQFDTENIPPGEVSLNYSRESSNYQANSGLPISRFEIERLTLGLKFSEKFELWNYSIGGSYLALNPLTAEQNELIESFKDGAFFFSFGLNIFENTAISIKKSRDIMLPQLYSIYPELNHNEVTFDLAQTCVNNSFEFSFEHKVSNDFNYALKYFNLQFENIPLPLSLIDYQLSNFLNSFTNEGVELAMNFDLLYIAKLKAFAQYYFQNNSVSDSYGRQIISPDLRINLTLSNSYTFGFSWQLQIDLISGRESQLIDNYKLRDFVVANVILNQKVYDNNEIYVKVHNLTDTYYEYFYGMPMPGIYFVTGIKLAL